LYFSNNDFFKFELNGSNITEIYIPMYSSPLCDVKIGTMIFNITIDSQLSVPKILPDPNDPWWNSIVCITILTKTIFNFGSMNFVIQYTNNTYINDIINNTIDFTIQGTSISGSSGTLFGSKGIISIVPILNKSVYANYVYLEKYN